MTRMTLEELKPLMKHVEEWWKKRHQEKEGRRIRIVPPAIAEMMSVVCRHSAARFNIREGSWSDPVGLEDKVCRWDPRTMTWTPLESSGVEVAKEKGEGQAQGDAPPMEALKAAVRLWWRQWDKAGRPGNPPVHLRTLAGWVEGLEGDAFFWVTGSWSSSVYAVVQAKEDEGQARLDGERAEALKKAVEAWWSHNRRPAAAGIPLSDDFAILCAWVHALTGEVFDSGVGQWCKALTPPPPKPQH